MKIHIANESKQGLGGGWTFLRNFTKYAAHQGVQFVGFNEKPDIFFIAGATMVKRETVEEAKRLGMKIVLRIDNAPRNSRNRNTGTSRLRDFARMADLVVFQSEWALDYLGPWLEVDGPVIINGADEEIFNTTGPRQPKEALSNAPQYLFAQYNRDETKRWHEAWYHFSRIWRMAKDRHLWIVGNFSPEQQEYNFDFFMGERYRYIGVLENPADFAEYLRGTDILLLPYYNDACSNTMIEARLCGVRDIRCNATGGNLEIMQAKLEHLTAAYMCERYIKEFEKIL